MQRVLGANTRKASWTKRGSVSRDDDDDELHAGTGTAPSSILSYGSSIAEARLARREPTLLARISFHG